MKLKKESNISAIERTRIDETKLEEFDLSCDLRNKFNYGIKSTNKIKKTVKKITAYDCSNLTGEPGKTKPGKLKSFFCFCTKKNKETPGLKKFNYDVKKSGKETQKSDKSLQTYFRRNWKPVIFLFFMYLLAIGTIISTPVIVNHFKVTSQNQTEKERFIKMFTRV